MTKTTDIWPDHAYVPGKTPRHSEGAFDALRITARPDLDAEELAGTQAFVAGMRYLRAGFYWECHEVLEPVWMALPEGTLERRFVQGVIQAANGWLKLEMQRPKAALRLVKIARDLLPDVAGAVTMGVQVSEMHRLIDSLEERANVEI